MPAESFDPSKALEAARLYAGPTSKLVEFEAHFVRSDGTMDLTASYNPRLEYQFIRHNPNAEATPVGTGAKDNGFERINVNVHQPGLVSVTSFGGGCERSGTFYDLGMEREVHQGRREDFDGSPATPQCSLAEVWTAARKQADIPKEAVAIIEYTRKGYDFRIYDLDVHLRFTPRCETVEELERLEQKRQEDERLAEAARAEAKELDGNAGGPGRKVEIGGNSTEKQVASGLEKDTGIGNKKVDIEGITKIQAVVRVGSSDGEATGELPKATIKSYIAAKRGAIISCYEKGLRANPDLSGKVKVAFLIQPTGGVLGARVDDSSLNNSSVEECILNEITNWHFPPAKGGGSTKVVYPFVFSSTQ